MTTTAAQNPSREPHSSKAGLYAYRVLVYFVMILLSLLCLFFFYVLIINATRPHAEIQKGFSLLPGSYLGRNWQSLMSNAELPIFRGMFNSLKISALTALLSTYFSALTAYAIHAYDFKLKNAAFKFILLIMTVPAQVSALGFLQLVRNMGLMNSHLPLFLPSIAACFVGGTNAGGGRSNIIAVAIGAFMMTLMSTFLNAAHISAGAQRLIQGVFIVLLLCAATKNPNKKS